MFDEALSIRELRSAPKYRTLCQNNLWKANETWPLSPQQPRQGNRRSGSWCPSVRDLPVATNASES